MDATPDDLDATRAVVADRGLLATVSGYLTADVAVSLPFEALGSFKDLLKRFFSTAPWSERDAAALSDLVSPHVAAGWWEHDLGGGIVLAHGIRAGTYTLWVSGAEGTVASIFDRAFDGPVVPEATPHPRKVKFTFGGHPGIGRWHRRGDADPPQDPRLRRLLDEPDVTDVMVAGDFVTVGLAGTSSWEARLEPLLALVTELFAADPAGVAAPERTREELLQEAGRAGAATRDAELHLLDPDDPAHADRLRSALDAPDPRTRRVAVAILAEAASPAARREALRRGYADPSRLVRRTAVDAAADTADPSLRGYLEEAAASPDSWIRWRAVKALGAIGVGSSRPLIEARTGDPEFRVRFEAERVLHEAGEPR